MRAGYRKFFMFAQVATLIGIGYLMTRFWEDAKKQCEKELIKEILKTQQIICQNGISDRMKGIDEKIKALENFLSQNK